MQALSPQQTFLLNLAAEVWERRGAAKRTGLHFNEETATELLLLDLERSFPGNVTIVPFNKNQEAEAGADWAWAFVDADGTSCQTMLVQAKRLDDVDKSYRQLQHHSRSKTAASQIDKLIDTARRHQLPPVYAFYNHLGDPTRLVNTCGSILSNAPAHAKSWGVTLASAFAVRDALPDNTFDRHRHHSTPLHCILCTRGTGDHTQFGLAEAASFALTKLFHDSFALDDADSALRPPFRPLESLPALFLHAEDVGDPDAIERTAPADLEADHPGIAGVVIVRDGPSG